MKQSLRNIDVRDKNTILEMHIAVGLFTILAITIYFACFVRVLNISILKLG